MSSQAISTVAPATRFRPSQSLRSRPVHVVQSSSDQSCGHVPAALDQLLQSAGNPPEQSYQEEQLLARAQRADRDAYHQLVQMNLKLIHWVAIQVMAQWDTGQMQLDDLVQEGCLGLVQAIQKWRPGHRFSTYAVPWIYQSITRAVINCGHPIRRPAHWYERANQRQLQQFPELISLDQPDLAGRPDPDPSDLDPLLDQLSDPQPDPADQTIDQLTEQACFQLMDQVLTYRERYVLRAQLGLGQPAQPASEIAVQLHCSLQTVDLLYRSAITKLRSRPETYQLLGPFEAGRPVPF